MRIYIHKDIKLIFEEEIMLIEFHPVGAKYSLVLISHHPVLICCEKIIVCRCGKE